MKKAVLILLLLSFTKLNAQIIKLKDLEIIKNSKLIVAQTENEFLNEAIKDALEKYWTLNEVAEYMPRKEAYKKAKSNDDLLVFALSDDRSISSKFGSGPVRYRYISKGQLFELSNGKGRPIFTQYIPTFGENDAITEEIVKFGIDALQYSINTMFEKQLKNNLKLFASISEKTPLLKNKTLIIAEGWVSEKYSAEELKEDYIATADIVDYEKWRNTILTEAENTAYNIVVPVPLGGKYVYYHYLMDAENGEILGIAYTKVAVSIGKFSITKSNRGYIRKQNITLYNELIEN